MKVRELIEALEKANPDLDVVVASDAEGNECALVAPGFTLDRFDEDSPAWSLDSIWDEDGDNTQATAIIIWPVG